MAVTSISIHALLAESDPGGPRPPAPPRHFYPRSPCGERRFWACLDGSARLFLSTLSLRRATGRHRSNHRRPVYFYPRSPCGERLGRAFWPGLFFNFYPRSPCGERQTTTRILVFNPLISIHALLAESDRFHAADISARRISIHALLAESDDGFITRGQLPAPFLSTLSLRRATYLFASSGVDFSISIHALLAESD